jgi:hypothetical protein
MEMKLKMTFLSALAVNEVAAAKFAESHHHIQAKKIKQ